MEEGRLSFQKWDQEKSAAIQQAVVPSLVIRGPKEAGQISVYVAPESAELLKQIQLTLRLPNGTFPHPGRAIGIRHLCPLLSSPAPEFRRQALIPQKTSERLQPAMKHSF